MLVQNLSKLLHFLTVRCSYFSNVIGDNNVVSLFGLMKHRLQPLETMFPLSDVLKIHLIPLLTDEASRGEQTDEVVVVQGDL